MRDFFILNLATLGPIGKKLPAPGTMGSIAGLLVFGILTGYFQFSVFSVILGFTPLLLIGVPLCSNAEKIMNQSDPSEVIWDEFCVIPFIFLFLDETSLDPSHSQFYFWLTAGFILFRFFDILKPLGINKLQNLPKGWGVMTDDFAAALISALILGILQTFPLSFF